MADNESQKPLDDSVSGVIDTLSGPQKAAAILVAIGRPSASRLLKHFNAEDLRKLAGHARTLEPISPLDFEHLVKQFEDSFAEGAPVSEAAQRFEGLLREALPQDEADAVFEERVQPQLVQESVWVQLARLRSRACRPISPISIHRSSPISSPNCRRISPPACL